MMMFAMAGAELAVGAKAPTARPNAAKVTEPSRKETMAAGSCAAAGNETSNAAIPTSSIRRKATAAIRMLEMICPHTNVEGDVGVARIRLRVPSSR